MAKKEERRATSLRDSLQEDLKVEQLREMYPEEYKRVADSLEGTNYPDKVKLWTIEANLKAYHIRSIERKFDIWGEQK